jgi:hypothetical protein
MRFPLAQYAVVPNGNAISHRWVSAVLAPPYTWTMQWLLHGNHSPAVGAALVRLGHKIHALEELALPPDSLLADTLKAAVKRQWEVISNDPAVVRAVFDERIPFERSIVFLQLRGGEAEQGGAVDRLFGRYKRLAPKRLYTVTETRVKIRQLPSAQIRRSLD